ncbi:MAG: hypothetical protein E7522_07915 [Ruminococcaceae bacterium]|nr:hypothetical protein [Oscillospiraceae bacterium]
MTVSKALEIFNNETENEISDELKKQWLSELDVKIAGEINKGRNSLLQNGFSPEQALTTELTAVEEFSEIYISYLRMKMNYMLGEIERYNNSAAIFNRLYYEMSNFVSRNYQKEIKNSIKVELGNV